VYTGAGEVEQMRSFGLIQMQRAGQRIEHAVGRAAEVAALEAVVVVDAEPGEGGDLLAPQAGHYLPSQSVVTRDTIRLLLRP
jgi:transcriptional regulator of aromatic amino acid metabolism